MICFYIQKNFHLQIISVEKKSLARLPDTKSIQKVLNFYT